MKNIRAEVAAITVGSLIIGGSYCLAKPELDAAFEARARIPERVMTLENAVQDLLNGESPEKIVKGKTYEGRKGIDYWTPILEELKTYDLIAVNEANAEAKRHDEKGKAYGLLGIFGAIFLGIGTSSLIPRKFSWLEISKVKFKNPV